MSKAAINSLLLILFMFINVITYPIKVLVLNQYINLIFVGCIVFISLYINKAYKQIHNYVIFGMIFLLLAINFFSTENETNFIKNTVDFLKFGGVALYLSIQKIDYKNVVKYWNVMSIVTLVIFTLYINEVINRNINYMFFGVSMSYVFAIQFYLWLDNKKITNIILSVYSFCLLITFGNRGALVTSAVIVIIVGFTKMSPRGKKILFGSIVGVLVLYWTSLLGVIVKSLNLFLNSIGIKSYAIWKISIQLENGISRLSTSGRNELYSEAFDLIKSAQFMPKGIGFYQSVTGHIYPHNFLLELLIIFGFLSIPILIGFIILLINFYFDKDNCILKKEIMTLLLTITFTRLSLSSSFLIEITFWIILGLLYSNKVEKYKNILID